MRVANYVNRRTMLLSLYVRRLTFSDGDDEKEKVITVEPHIIPNRGPYVYNQPKRFTASLSL